MRLVCLAGLLTCSAVWAESPEVPFVDALARADIVQERIDDVLEHALIVGNGDVNALLYSAGDAVIVSLTKNDVWDARLLSAGDPPLPSIARLEALAADGWPEGVRGEKYIIPGGGDVTEPDSYHAYPHPCPLQCAEVALFLGGNERVPRGQWKQVRGEGAENAFVNEGASGVMLIAGKPGASNGFSHALDTRPGAAYTEAVVRVRGSENARFFVDVMDAAGRPRMSSGWRESPPEAEDFVFPLPTDTELAAIILYSWTEDGNRAENVFERVSFVGGANTVDLAPGNPENTPMPARLSLATAKAEIAPVADRTRGATVRVLAQRNAFLIETEGRAALRPVTPPFLPRAQTGRDGEVEWLKQDVPGDLDWPGMAYAVALAQGAGKVAVGIASSLETDAPLESAIDLARATLEEDTAASAAAHESAWRAFWAASGIELDDPVLEQNWYRALYFLRCVTREGAVSPGLFAGLIDATPAWHGDYHLNYNLQQTFWSAYVTNHCDLAEPYDRLMAEYLVRARWLARQVYDCEGAFFPHVLFAYEPPDPAACRSDNGRQYIHHTWGLTLGVAGFAVQPCWWRYKYAPDMDLLRETTYPLMREVALFYADFIEGCERGVSGKVRLGPTVSPEHWGWTPGLDRNYDCAFDIAMARYTIAAAIEGATALGTDQTLTARWRAALEALPPYPTTRGDKPIVVDVAGAPPIEYNISVPATPVYPGDVVSWFSGEAEKELFARTINRLEWNGNNATFMLAISRARLSMEGTPAWLRDEVVARQRPNGTLTLNVLGHHFNAFGHYTEQFGVAQAVSELLVQSVGDTVRVFPAWPKEKPARFENLRTQGGFLVSGACGDGVIRPIRVTATVAGGFRFVPPWARVSVRGQDVAPDATGVCQVEMDKGETVTLEEGSA